jgi:hypothetical protein
MRSLDREPQYVTSGDGFFPDALAVNDDIDDVPSSDFEGTPGAAVVLGKIFVASTGRIKVGTKGETVELPPEYRRTAQVIGSGIDGELAARPATASERGGGLPVVLANELVGKMSRSINLGLYGALPPCYQPSSIRLLFSYP